MRDTFKRSCKHWSETSRNEMENFYALASIDYKYLAEKKKASFCITIESLKKYLPKSLYCFMLIPRGL